MTTKIQRLLALSDMEFNKNRAAPVRTRFKARPVNLTTLDRDWDRQRGAAARMMAIILREDSESLFRKVGASAETAATFGDAVGWLEKEAVYLRKTANRYDLAVSRLSSAISRHQEELAGQGNAGIPPERSNS